MFLKCALGAKRINIGFFPSWQYRSTHPVEAGIQLRCMVEYGIYGIIVAEALSVRLPPIAQLLGVLERVCMDGVLLLQKPRCGRAEYSSLTRFLSSTALHGGFPSGGISSHWQRAWSFTPTRSCGSCGCGPRGGTTHSLWSLNWGCWDHPPI